MKLFNAKATQLVDQFVSLTASGSTEIDVHSCFCALTLDIIIAAAFNGDRNAIAAPNAGFSQTVKALINAGPLIGLPKVMHSLILRLRQRQRAVKELYSLIEHLLGDRDNLPQCNPVGKALYCVHC